MDNKEKFAALINKIEEYLIETEGLSDEERDSMINELYDFSYNYIED